MQEIFKLMNNAPSNSEASKTPEKQIPRLPGGALFNKGGVIRHPIQYYHL